MLSICSWALLPLLLSSVTAQTDRAFATSTVPAPAESTYPPTPAPTAPGVPPPNDDGEYVLEAEGIRAAFIPYGASLSKLFLNDSNGIERDVVVGFDNASYYSVDQQHPHLNSVPGRYANRIRNSSFVIDGVEYNVIPNENMGRNTLHGGPNGWDYRNFTTVAYTSTSVTFMLTDPAGAQGFPGEVISYITYTVAPYTWHIKMTALSTQQKTPLMLTQHTYWNLDGFQNNETATALNHTMYLPYSGLRVGIDGILIPTGELLPNPVASVNDFWSSPKQVGADFDDPEIEGNCGTGCVGYDNCWIVSRNGPYDWRQAPVAHLSSAFSGIQMEIFSEQQAIQMYSCHGQNGSSALKQTQGFFDDASRPRTIQPYGCVVMEVQDWIDGINHPEWQRDGRQIFGPQDGPYVLEAEYRFSTMDPSPCQDG